MEKVITLRSLIDGWCGIGGGWKKYRKLLVKGVGIIGGWKNLEN